MARYTAQLIPASKFAHSRPKGKFWDGSKYSYTTVVAGVEYVPIVTVRTANAVDLFCVCELLAKAMAVADALNGEA
jgi:hypothetical protein